MAAFSAIYAEVGDYLHDLDASMDTRVKEWINLAQQDVATEAYWPWLLREDTLSTTTDITTGTAAVVSGSATVDFSTASLPTKMEYGQYYFKPDDTAIWYPVASRNEIQTITLSAGGGSDTYMLAFISGSKTTALLETATAATVQTALIVLSDFDSGDVTVTGEAGGPYSVEFAGQYAGQDVQMLVASDEAGTLVVAIAETAADTLTLSSDYIDDTDATADYTIRRVLYSLPSDVGNILTVRRYSGPVRLRKMTPGTLDIIDPGTVTVGDSPYSYMLFGVDSSGYQQVYFFPVMTEADVIQFRYFKVLTDLSDDADISAIPVDFHEALVWGACWRGYRFLDDQQNAQTSKFEYDGIIRRMRKRYLTTPDDIFRKGAIDEYHAYPTRPRFPTDTISSS